MNLMVNATNGVTSYPSAQKSAEPEAASSAQQSAAARTDRLELSDAASAQKDALRAQKEAARAQQDAAQARLMQFSEVTRQLKQAQAEAEAKAEEAKMRLLCIKIAMRIMAGDKVPPEDEKYLLENDPQLYTVAINMRQQKEDPEEYDSLLEDDEKNTESAEGAEGIPDLSKLTASASSPDLPAPAEAAPAEAVPE